MKYRPRAEPKMLRITCAECGQTFEVDEKTRYAQWSAAWDALSGEDKRCDLEPICDACAAKDGAA